MSERMPFVVWYGRDEPPVPTRHLRAGPASVLLEGCDLRYLRIGGREIVRRLYVAVRDQHWGTIPLQISDLAIDETGDGFTVRFTARHRQREIDFVWRGEISGAADGAIQYTMEGLAESAFLYNRIGLCVLHPPAENAGQPYQARTPDGPITGHLPERIGPQRIEGGQIFALFPAYDQLTIGVAGGGEARFDFEGDLFEMEDQRNWTDDSFKTYSTPLARPIPQQAQPGQTIRQRVTVTTRGLPATTAPSDEPARLTLGAPLGRSLPPIGFGLASHGQPLTAGDVARLRALRPAHLRADLRPRSPGWEAEVARARQEAAALGCRLELALFLGDEAAADLERLAVQLAAGLPLARLLVFHAGPATPDRAVSTGPLVALARRHLQPVVGDVPFVGGTNIYFTELNRDRPDLALVDGVAYSINPQVHAFDETSLVETLAAQGETVISARAFSGDRPLIVGPITLKPRFNPHARGPVPDPAPDELPPAVDPRQMSLFGAVWTAGSLKYLAESGAASLTYYETTGWRGVLETAAGAPLPARFPSRPGQVFPLYHVFADAAEWATGELVACQSSAPLAVVGLAARLGPAVHLLVGNLTAADQPVTIGPLANPVVQLRRLAAGQAPLAVAEPERFRTDRVAATTTDGSLTLTLRPYELLRLDDAQP